MTKSNVIIALLMTAFASQANASGVMGSCPFAKANQIKKDSGILTQINMSNIERKYASVFQKLPAPKKKRNAKGNATI